jgi:hypothetical protein
MPRARSCDATELLYHASLFGCAAHVEASVPLRRLLRGPPVMRLACVSFEPGVDPFGLEPDRAAPSDACVVNLATLARSVDRVPAHAGILRSSATFIQIFIANSSPDDSRLANHHRLASCRLAADALSSGRECTSQHWFNASIVENLVSNRIGPEAWVRTEGAFPTDGDARSRSQCL